MTKKNEKALVTQEENKPDIQGALLQLTQNPEIDPERLEKFMQLQERWEDRQAEKAFNVAMAAFQGECPIIEKVKKGARSKYAPIEHLVVKIKPLLDKHGLAYSFNTQGKNAEETIMLTTISHVGGHSKTSEYTFNTIDDGGNMNGSQRRKSALSYAKRAGLENALGIVTAEEDDDAAKAEGHPASAKQKKYIEVLIKETESDRDAIKQWLGIESFSDISEIDAKKAIVALETKKNAAKKK